MPIVTHVRGPVIPGSAQRLFIAAGTPDKFHPPFVAALFEAVSALAAAGIQADFCMEIGNCHVDDMRNSLVRQFLMTDCTDLIFIDTDVGFRAEDLVKLASFNRDLVAGVYPKKQDDEEFPIALEPGAQLWAEPDGCVVKGVVGLPTGFMRIRRHVLETMVETFKPRSFAGSGSKPGDPLYTIVFEREIFGGKRYSGDYNFCRRWLALGGELAVDPSMVFAHEGAKQWTGQLATFWRRKHGVTEQAFNAAVEQMRAGDSSEQTLAALCEGWDNGGWQGSPLMLAAAQRLALRADGPILETGSGLSTLVLALTRPDLQIHTLEHDPIWATRTRDALEKANVRNVTLHYAPLGDVPFYEGDGFEPVMKRWYVAPRLPALDWALVVNDGPPRTKGDRAALYLAARLDHAAILTDDTDDPVQLAALKSWAATHGREILTSDDEGKGISVCHAPQRKDKAA